MNRIEVLCVDETITVLIDGKVIDYLFDPIEFVTPIQSEYCNQFFFTCTCDIAGCAGWHEGFHVTRQGQTVKWELLDVHKTGIAANLIFDAEQYQDAQYECLDQLYAMADRRSRATFDPPLDEYEEPNDRFFMSFTNKEELDFLILRATKWAEDHR